MLTKSEPRQIVNSGTLHRIVAVDEDAARGQAFIRAGEAKPGFSVHEIMVMEHIEGVDYSEPKVGLKVVK